MATATGSDVHANSPRDTLTGVAARSVPVARAHPLTLPTPPNSISPALPPHGLKAQLQKAARLDPIDSDLDLQDGSDDDNGRDNGKHGASVNYGGVAALAAAAAASGGFGSPPFESADAITPTMLAKYHLPEILLNHGPLAIRYIIGHLTATVPGFSSIPPAKSRRLVVAAMEGKGNGVEGGMGGLDGDVEFQKVSWGVWGARRLGGGGRPLPSPPPHGALGIPIFSGYGSEPGAGAAVAGRMVADRLRQHEKGSGALYRGEGIEDMTMMENEADKMSMDDEDDDNDGGGSGSASCSEAPDEDAMMHDNPEDLTDDEDWGAVGAAALRAASYSNSATAGRFSGRSFLSSRPPQANFSNLAAATTSGRQLPFSTHASAEDSHYESTFGMHNFSPFQAASDEQEREAVEALLRLGSV
ncbi:Sin3 binding protein [Niveomyces insectorum RCEF 264]|uniref:Sin3 binding protein n=1 Tax=Niveomyces insectorum RCEF 264 TaxID=1081102 RepID=A0A167RAQ1_9HYPO|nr:Sin3 binding protein [Niveomyces insectorum RCEF 264]